LFIDNLYCQNQNINFENSERLKDSIGNIYGLDPILYNGKLYNYYPQKKIIGNQYLTDEKYLRGEIIIREKKFSNLSLNYDIFNQELILKYNNSFNFVNSLIVSKAWLQEFTIGSSRFKLLILNNFPERIYQVIGNDSIQIYYFIKKDLKLDNVSGQSSYEFILQKLLYIYENNRLIPYTNNKSFIHFFDIKNRLMIKKYLRKHKIKVKKASDQVMEQLINYCNDI